MTSGGGAKEPEGEGRESTEPSGGGGASRILGRAGRRYTGGAWPVAASRWTGRGLERGRHLVTKGGLEESF